MKGIQKKSLVVILLVILFSSAINVYPAGKGFRPNFRNTDIEDFIKSMSAIIGKNILLDDRVKGKITIISPEYIEPKYAYAYLSSVLALKGFALVDTGFVLKVVPAKDAVAISPVILLGREPVDQDFIDKNTVVTHIIPTLTTKPSRLMSILKRITNPNTDIIDFDETGMLILTGNAPEVARLVKIIVEIDPEGERKSFTPESFGNIHIYPLHNMAADKLEATLRKISMPEPETPPDPNNPQLKRPQVPNQRTGAPGTIPSKIDIVGHKETNSMIYVGTDEEFQTVKKLIESLDQPRDQVLLEMLIIEVAATKINDFGIDWRVGGANSFGGASAQLNTGELAASSLIKTTTAPISPPSSINDINTLNGFSLGFMNGSTSIMGILNANMNKNNFVILSAPQILTLDNQEAEINVGEDVPVITGQRNSGADTQLVTINNYEYKPVGVKVKFTPQISNDEMVTLDLYQEIKSISGGTTSNSINPTFTKRDIKTVIRVADGQTIVIGGLISNKKDQSLTKVPVLGDIPILGYLFKRQSTTVTRTNLLVFITPHILTNRTLADRVTEEAKRIQIKETEKINREK